jgi:antitoxin HicB
MRFAYPIDIGEERDGVTVTCPDVPEMVTAGATRAEALAHAPDALVSALSFYVDENRPLPRPSPARGRAVIAVPALEAAKLALHDAMLAAKISNVELARQLGLDEKIVRRLRDPLHRSRIEAVEAALQALGRRLEVSVQTFETLGTLGEGEQSS